MTGKTAVMRHGTFSMFIINAAGNERVTFPSDRGIDRTAPGQSSFYNGKIGTMDGTIRNIL